MQAGWHDKWLRIMLYNVFVRSVLMYGCVVWGEHLVAPGVNWCEDRTGKFGTHHRKSLRAILGIGRDVRNEIVYVLACEWPLQAHIIKQLHRYSEGMHKHPRLVTEIA